MRLLFSSNNSFDILLVFAAFLQTYCDTYSSHILFFYFFLQISFYIYLLPALIISLYFYSNLLLYLLSNLCFFDSKLSYHPERDCIHSFLYITEKKYYFNWCFIWIKIHIYNAPLSYVTELFNLFKPSFLLTPIKTHLKVAPFVLNIAMFFKE